MNTPDITFPAHYSNLCKFGARHTWARAVCGSSPGQWIWVSRAPPSSAPAPTWSSGSDCRQKTKREKWAWAHEALIQCMKMSMYVSYSCSSVMSFSLVSSSSLRLLSCFWWASLWFWICCSTAVCPIIYKENYKLHLSFKIKGNDKPPSELMQSKLQNI